MPLLRAAADKAGCEAVLALADIRTTHSAFAADEGYRYQDWYDEHDDEHSSDEYSSAAAGGEGEYDIRELIDSEVTLTHWTGPGGTRLEETSLHVDRRGSMRVHPDGRTSRRLLGVRGVHGQLGQHWTGGTTGRRSSCGPVSRPSRTVPNPRHPGLWTRSPRWRQRATCRERGPPRRQVAPFWDTVLGVRTPEARGRVLEVFGPALRAADAVSDAPTAAMLLRPFHIEDLDHESVDSFGKITGRYGQRLDVGTAADVVRRGSADVGLRRGQERPQWVAVRLPGLCARLHASGSVGATAAQRLLSGVGLARQGHRHRARVVRTQLSR